LKKAYMKRRFFTKAHHHFAEIRETKLGNPYVVLVQSTKRNEKWSRQHVVIFKNEMKGLISFLEKFRNGMKSGNYKVEQDEIIDEYEAYQAYQLEEMEDNDWYELDQILKDLSDDLDDYSASDREGWFYRD